MINLDYAADTPACEPVLEAFVHTARTYQANPNAGHAMGAAANARLSEATAHIAAMIGVQPSEVILTSGATEANNMAILGVAHAYRSRGDHLLTSPMEHASVTGPMGALKAEGYAVEYLKTLPDGRVDVAHLQSLLRPETLLLSLCAVDSEVGVLQPIAEVSRVVRAFPNCRLHVDATQAMGKLPLVLDGVDLITFSPHKFFGLTGCGVLAVRGGLRLAPLWYGGTGATPYRSGTPALALAVAAETALAEALRQQEARLLHVRALNHRLRDALAALPFIQINSPTEASPFILNFSVTGLSARALIAHLSEQGICVSSKSACCAPAAPSHPVMAMTGDRKRAMNTVRVSLSPLNTEADAACLIRELRACGENMEATHEHLSGD